MVDLLRRDKHFHSRDVDNNGDEWKQFRRKSLFRESEMVRPYVSCMLSVFLNQFLKYVSVFGMEMGVRVLVCVRVSVWVCFNMCRL